MNTPATIFFDESGYTGNNLLHPGQRIFSYGSVQAEPDEAREFVSSLIKRYNIQNGELKGKNLIKFNKGRRAISEILKHFEGRMKASVSDKKYALAGKFYEYIFEPPLQKNNMLFYELNFHRFISNILYLEFVARGAAAEEIFRDFEALMRSGSFEGLDNLFSSTTHKNISPVLGHIREFAILNRPVIAEELDGYVGTGSGKWVLDLTNTALFSLLAQWGKDFAPITAVCDQSAPLSADQNLFNVMINRTDKKFTSLGGQDTPLTFNLAAPLQLVDSKGSHGVQLADCVAAAFAYACDNQVSDDAAKEWRKYIESTLIFGSVFPDLDHVNLEMPAAQRNLAVLMELLGRCRGGKSLLDGMHDFVNFISHELVHNPPQFRA